jgi:diaminopimelate epimerase
MAIEFTKIHGCANDFVVVDRRREAAPVSPEAAIRWCDRHRGIGADGVLSVLPSQVAPLAMHVTNPDGSVAEMCGNGLRCVVRWAVDRGLLPAGGGPVETGRGVLECVVEADGHVRVDMGRPILEPARVPVLLPGERVVAHPIEILGETLVVTTVSMGNPHAVSFLDEGVDPLALARRLSRHVETSPLFPRRVNAGFARMEGRASMQLAVWERGAGLTMACGTGACAAAVAAVLTGRAGEGVPVSVALPGGTLRVTVAPGLERVWMSGPAVAVYEGRVPAP